MPSSDDKRVNVVTTPSGGGRHAVFVLGTLILVHAICAVSVVDAASLGVSSSRPLFWKVADPQPQQDSTVTSSVLQVRGGGMMGGMMGRNKKMERQWQEMERQDMVRGLNGQVRKMQNELEQLRTKFRSLVKERRMDASNSVRTNMVELMQLRDEIQTLMKTITNLNHTKDQWEHVAEVQKERIDELEALLVEQQETLVDTQLQHQEELDHVRETLLEQSRQELFAAERDAKLYWEEEKEQLITHYEGRLQEERTKSQDAVEAERVRMRRLVKALAEREKQLNNNNNNTNKKKSNKTSEKVKPNKPMKISGTVGDSGKKSNMVDANIVRGSSTN
uniref:Uncharacterized protein n=1 Tax=Attheya septentrionalis TaxID=420275 RepID=A0A7S2XUY6_9STRA|mmetsp:Transcript_4175/g.7487  ORF Transcript_4175/g.7487 Transcript_4175/m.7487 type:complete len:334 (+) Transcript_4175:177-1178(+)